MPINPTFINTNNLNPNLGLGISLYFSGPGLFNSTYSTQEAIKANLVNYMLTSPGEIPLNPSFGGGLREFLFEQINDGNLNNIKINVQDKIAEVFPMVVISELNVFQDPSNENSILIELFYSMPSISPTATGSLQFSNNTFNVI